MTRSARSHALISLVLWVAVGSSIASVTTVEGQPVAVEGKNDPAVDVQAVQKAVDRGGTVLLKGRFDFGDKGSVTITKDVNVLGETDERGAPRTTIRGGHYAFHSPLTTQTLPPPGPKITIKNIHFDGALWAPIRLAYASGVTIAGNRITGVRPHPAPDRRQIGLQHGILVGTLLPMDRRGQYQPGAVVGTVAIADNDIDLSTEAPTKTMAQGIFVFGTTGINARIARNTITNCARNSIEVLDNYLSNDGGGFIVIQDNKIVTATEGVARPTPQTPNGIVVGYFRDTSNYLSNDGGGFIVIQDNKIVTATEGVALPGPRTPNGIVVGYFRDRSAAVDPKRLIRHVILHNNVRARGKTSDGISVLTDGALVRNNHVVTEGPEAHAIRAVGSNTYIGRNKIEGSGALGLELVPTAPMTASGNEMEGNDFEQFKAAIVDVMVDKGANGNVVVGTNGSVIDLGAGNEIRGLKRLTK